MTENDVWGLVGRKRVKLSHLGECLGPPTLWVLAGAPYTLKLIKFQAVERLQEGNEVPDCRGAGLPRVSMFVSKQRAVLLAELRAFVWGPGAGTKVNLSGGY